MTRDRSSRPGGPDDPVMQAIRDGHGAMQTLMQAYRPDTSVYLLAEHLRRRMASIADVYAGRRDVLMTPGHSTRGVKAAMRTRQEHGK